MQSSGAVGKLGISFAFGLTIFAIVYSSAGISGGHINPAVTFAGRISALKGSLYIIAQMVGSICGAAIVHAVNKTLFSQTNGGANFVQPGYDKGDALGVEIIGTFVLITTVFAATDPVRSCREGSPHISALAPFAIGVAVFIVHLAIIPIDGTSINPARSFGPAVIYNKDFVWDDQWIFWVGPGIGALVAVFVYEWFIRGADFRSMQRKHQ
ncbi:aquaporin [Klebsormidium nitens]|uniref:Aquaporin n=1 Tax=Klebsormidium nitens TaxID=105231 RepID=A0A1Y1I4M6_KLENI|nr:aquaporin [Klebsormidium nitens]|eukprot:GAQ85890.1 aquaporin [Klebsormidium nitens]